MLNSAETAETLEKVGHARLVVVGDVMLDTYIVGNSSRLSPEAPVPVLLVERETSTLGGAGNAFANIISFGAKAALIGCVGDDAQGDSVKQMVKDTGGNSDLLLTDISRPTISKTRYLQGHQHLLRCDREITDAISEDIRDEVFTVIKSQLNGVDVLVLSDYDKGLFRDADFLRTLIKLAKDKNILVIADPKGKDFSKYQGADFITPNAKELAEATGQDIAKTDGDVEKQANLLIEKYGLAHVLVTRSEDGLSLISSNGKHTHIPTHVEKIFDVSGAGDTVLAVFACLLATGLAPEKCAWLANKAGSIVVKKSGTSLITQSELVEKVA